MSRQLVKLSIVFSILLGFSLNTSLASPPTYQEEDAPYTSRMQIRNYSTTLTYLVTLRHHQLGERTIFLDPKTQDKFTEKRIEDFFPNESFRDMPHHYGLDVACYMGEELFIHQRFQVELFTLIALFDPKSYDVEFDCNNYSNLRLGTSSYLLPENLNVDDFTAYTTLSKVRGAFPYYKVSFNPTSPSQSKSVAPPVKNFLDNARITLEAYLELQTQRHHGRITGDKNDILKTLFCFHEGLLLNGYVRPEQVPTYLRILTEAPTIVNVAPSKK